MKSSKHDSRQVTRRKLFRENYDKLRSTDFPDAPVAVRDDLGKAVVHRPAISVLRDMARQKSKRQWKEISQERKAERERDKAV